VRLKQLEDFLAVVECGGIRAAARKRGVSQPAITRSVRSLESDIGTHLLQRTPQGVLLTPSGRAFFTRVRAAHSELRKAEHEAATGAGASGSVAFGVGPSAGVLVVPEALAAFRRQFPDVQIRIMEGMGPQLGPLVRDGTLDFAVSARQHVNVDSTLAFKPLFAHQLVIAGRKGHPLRAARSLRDLAGAEWVSLFPVGAELATVANALKAAGLTIPRHAVQVESYRLLIALLAQSDMLGVLSSRILSRQFAGDSLEPIRISEKLPSYTTHLVTRSGIPLSRAAATMAKALLQTARRLAKT
jgi:LysR family transcriptional regulator of abg operon